MDLKLQNKTAIVTGASEGVGKVIALSLANEGCNVIICSRDKTKLIKATNEIKKNCKNKKYCSYKLHELSISKYHAMCNWYK